MTNQQPIGPFTVEHAGTTGMVDYFRVAKQSLSANANRAGEQVSVRVGIHGVFCCLTCNVTTCAHAQAARDYAEAFPPPKSEAA